MKKLLCFTFLILSSAFLCHGTFADVDVNNLFADITVKNTDGPEKSYPAGTRPDNLQNGVTITLLAGSLDVSLGKGSHATLKAGPLDCQLNGGDFVSASFCPSSNRLDIQAFEGTPTATNRNTQKTHPLSRENLTIRQTS